MLLLHLLTLVLLNIQLPLILGKVFPESVLLSLDGFFILGEVGDFSVEICLFICKGFEFLVDLCLL